MRRLFLLAAAIAGSWLGARTAAADCTKIKKGDVAACKKAASAKCDSIEKYWDKQACIQKVAVQFDGCYKDTGYQKACEPRLADYWEICRKAHDLDVNSDDSLAAWKQRLLAYDASMASLDAFDAEWKACYEHTLDGADDNTCQMSSTKVQECKQARAVFAKTLADAVDFFLTTGFEQGKQRIADELKRKDYPAAMQWADHTSERIALFEKLNADFPDFSHRAKEVAAARAEMKKHHAAAEKAYEKVIARNRCPRGKNNDKKVVAALRSTVDGFFHPAGDTSETVRVFRLDGKKISTHDAKLRETNEEIPAIACTEKKRDDAKVCRSFHITLRRTKPDGGEWGSWKVFVGSSERLLCKNVK